MEGGKFIVSGENGWASFDYHQAMFGSEDMPLQAERLQVAVPPHGCDPSQYAVRVSGTIVAILRGGGCSFGIKAIAAQELGAKAVVIVNTDDSKTMRLMASPDETAQITIPVIMISNKFQTFMEQYIKPFYHNDLYIASIQPTESIYGYG
jgi:hypothetical protein